MILKLEDCKVTLREKRKSCRKARPHTEVGGEEGIEESEDWPVRYKENQEMVDPEDQRKVFLGGCRVSLYANGNGTSVIH